MRELAQKNKAKTTVRDDGHSANIRYDEVLETMGLFHTLVLSSLDSDQG